MTLRPEFLKLDSHYQQLYYDIGVDKEFLKSVKDLIRLCEHIYPTNDENNVITRTTYWLEKRAALLGMGTETKLLPAAPVQQVAPVPKVYTNDDKRFLRSLRIANDEKKEGA